MKTLCGVVVALSLISVCRSASLACEQLLKPPAKTPDLSGRWHYIAMSTESCLVGTLMNAFLSPSLAMDISPGNGANMIEMNLKAKIYGYCVNETDSYLVKDNKLYDVDSSNAPTGDPDVMLQTSCSDCIVLKEDEMDLIDAFVLLSRRTSVSAEELQEFTAQAKCLGWSKPLLFNTDYDYGNCLDLPDDPTDELAEEVTMKVVSEMLVGLKRGCNEIIECIIGLILSPFSWLTN